MVAEHGEPLSARELEIIELVSEGLTNREIAARLYLSPNTIKVHLRNIFTKTGVASRTELSMLAVQQGWVGVPGSDETPVENSAPLAEPGAETATAEGAPVALELSPWPRTRQAALLIGVCLALVVLFLPYNPGRAVTPGDAGALVDAPQGAPLNLAPATEDGWRELSPLPVRRARLSLAAAGKHLYAIGGITEAGPTGQLDIYDIENDTWQSGLPRPAAWGNVGAVTLQNTILVPGGCDAGGQPHAAVHRYVIDAAHWEEVAPLPVPLCAYALTAHNGQAYLLGGWDGSRYRTLAYSYDPQADVWMELPASGEARGFGAAAALGGRIYYVGGYNDRRELKLCEAYLPTEARWVTCAPMLQPRGGLGLVAIGGRLQAVGGGWHTYLGFNERYDPNTATWAVLETPIVGEWRNLGLAVWDTSIYSVGGWSGDYLNRTYALEVLQFRIYIPHSTAGIAP